MLESHDLAGAEWKLIVVICCTALIMIERTALQCMFARLPNAVLLLCRVKKKEQLFFFKLNVSRFPMAWSILIPTE